MACCDNRRYRWLACLLVFVPLGVLHAQEVRVRVDGSIKPDASHPNLFATIQSALDHAPEISPHGRLFIEIAPGTYRERVYVSQLRP